MAGFGYLNKLAIRATADKILTVIVTFLTHNWSFAAIFLGRKSTITISFC